ncbi:L-asparagine transporter [Variovorax sp. HW608]|uniref:amino acid permease n=1 Tax=Variovorax sp. HW608 TaxID=1034889 RepID=UPI00081F91F6|nr:amino acid permease [Variovorax sp. HW608]SCK60510.1 L-asparagine transporter [Variovorax sp. HW608]
MDDDKKITDREQGLARTLTQRQLTMIGLGGAIGTGLFMGSGIAIGYAGPGVLLSYLIAALIAVVMMYSLSEMAVAHPTAGSFGTYAELYLNRWAGFVVRFTYWAAQSIAIGGEAVAIGLYMRFWFPDIPVWMWTTGFGAAIIYANARSASTFGSLEYWLSTIKIFAICAFIVFGLAVVFGIGRPAVGFGHYTAHDGFLPHGFRGVWMGVLIAIFSFYGIEIIAVTAGEAADPAKAVPRAMRTMIARLVLFYVLSLGIMLAIVPWPETGAKEVAHSPFVKVFTFFDFKYAAAAMNVVLISAALSSMNANLYLCSRMLFSLARAGLAPAPIGTLSASGAPVAAIGVSSIGVGIAVLTSMFSPVAYGYLFGVALGGGILVWLMILLSHLSFRRNWEKSGKAPSAVHAPWFPWLQYLGIFLLVAVLVTMAFDAEFWNVGVISASVWVAFLSGVYVFRFGARRQKAPLVET